MPAEAPERRYQSASELMVDLKNLARQIEHGEVPVTWAMRLSLYHEATRKLAETDDSEPDAGEEAAQEP